MKRLGIVAAVLFSGAAWAGDAPNVAVEALKKDIGAYGWRVMETATLVKVYALISSDESTGRPAGYQTGKDQSQEFSKRLRAAILEGQTEPPILEKACKFEPLLRFQFFSGNDHVDVSVDFGCEKLEITSMDPKAPQAVSTHRYFEDWRSALVRLSKEAFPDDLAVKDDLKTWTWEPNADSAKYVGAHAVKVLLAADKVEVFRIKPRIGDLTAKERQVAGGYPVISQGPDLGPAFAARLSTLLLSGKTTVGFDKRCDFSPGVAFIVHSGADTADLILCFACDELQATSYPKTAPDKVTGLFDMDSTRADWLELAKQALPADETIQALENKPK